MTDLCELCAEYERNKETSEIATLRCGHKFCWTCLNLYMKKNMNNKMICPSLSKCNKNISDKIIREILSSEDIEIYEKFCLQSIKMIHNCLLKQCTGTISYTDPNLQYECAICSLYNCVSCKASHPFYSCKQYQSFQISQKQRINREEIFRALQRFNIIKKNEMRNLLLKEDPMDVLLNDESFTCCLCNCSIIRGGGSKLRWCKHSFCTNCLVEQIKMSNDVPVKCPQDGCSNPISDREIQRLLSLDLLKKYLNRCTAHLKGKLRKFLQCKHPDCECLYHYSEMPLSFICVKCKNINCVSCNAIHSQEYCNELKNNRTNDNIELMIKNKKLMRCLDCKALLNKVSGCNWISCNNCGMELCWITQNYRWGPNGPGDDSGGCKCKIGSPCAPGCGGCIADTGRRHSRYSTNNRTASTQPRSGCLMM